MMTYTCKGHNALGLGVEDSSKFSSLVYHQLTFVAVYINASAILPKSCPYILRSRERNDATTSPAKSRLALPPRHNLQVYAHHSILRVFFQLLNIIERH